MAIQAKAITSRVEETIRALEALGFTVTDNSARASRQTGSSGQFSCPICERSFGSAQAISLHTRRAHPGRTAKRAKRKAK